MNLNQHETGEAGINKRVATSGFRFTPQRQHVYNVVMQQRDHPTVEDVFMRSKDHMPEISMATVYNCLDALVKCGLVRQVNLERSATRYCPNMQEHSHFHCEECGGIFDIECDSQACGTSMLKIPAGFSVKQIDIMVRGICLRCVQQPARRQTV